MFSCCFSVSAIPFNYSVIHLQAESICVGWGTPPFYDFSTTSGVYVPYIGATQTADLNTQDVIMGDNLTMQANTTTEIPNCTITPTANIIYWNKLENRSAEIGTDLLNVGTPIYGAGKFGNGLNAQASANVLKSDGAFISDINAGAIIEFWWKPDYTLTNGLPDNGLWNGWWSLYVDANNEFMMQMVTGAATVIYFVNGGVWKILDTRYPASGDELLPPAPWDWTAGTNYHTMWVFDEDGIGGTTDVFRIYFDGTMIFNSSNAVWLVPDNSVLYLGDMKDYGRPAKGIIDNIKAYNVTTQAQIDLVIANKDTENATTTSCTPYNTTTMTGTSIIYDGNLNMTTNLIVRGCIKAWNGTGYETWGVCI